MRKKFKEPFRVNFIIERAEWEKFRTAVGDRSQALRDYIYLKNGTVTEKDKLEHQREILLNKLEDIDRERQIQYKREIEIKERLGEEEQRMETAYKYCLNKFNDLGFIPDGIIINQAQECSVDLNELMEKVEKIPDIRITKTIREKLPLEIK